jgi:site-specific recombinase XerD
MGDSGIEKGIHPKVVQERLGHSKIGITLDIYSHVVAGWIRKRPRKCLQCFCPVAVR